MFISQDLDSTTACLRILVSGVPPGIDVVVGGVLYRETFHVIWQLFLALSYEWSAAKRALRSLLEDAALEGVGLEIFDLREASISSSFLINSQDPHIAVYEVFRENFIEYIDREFDKQ